MEAVTLLGHRMADEVANRHYDPSSWANLRVEIVPVKGDLRSDLFLVVQYTVHPRRYILVASQYTAHGHILHETLNGLGDAVDTDRRGSTPEQTKPQRTYYSV